MLGSYLLRLISDGSLEPEGEDDAQKKVKLRLVRPPRTEDQSDDAFYTVLEAAAGEDGVLPVSYTHLDVYKRQNLLCGNAGAYVLTDIIQHCNIDFCAFPDAGNLLRGLDDGSGWGDAALSLIHILIPSRRPLTTL